MPFQFKQLEIPDLILVEPRRFADDRGYFTETYKLSEFAANGIAARFVQDNYSYSAKGVLRGLHFQKPPQAQGKLLRVVIGEIFDVAVDIRRGSSTYSHWVGTVLSAENGRMLWVPPGFAHGFCVLSEVAGLTYKVTAEFAADMERGIRWDDPEIAIEWPLQEPLLSSRDLGLPYLNAIDTGFEANDAGRVGD
jgi:dTDP-4-dehydrorhamnose 3,5-epimerase